MRSQATGAAMMLDPPAHAPSHAYRQQRRRPQAPSRLSSRRRSSSARASPRETAASWMPISSVKTNAEPKREKTKWSKKKSGAPTCGVARSAGRRRRRGGQQDAPPAGGAGVMSGGSPSSQAREQARHCGAVNARQEARPPSCGRPAVPLMARCALMQPLTTSSGRPKCRLPPPRGRGCPRARVRARHRHIIAATCVEVRAWARKSRINSWKVPGWMPLGAEVVLALVSPRPPPAGAAVVVGEVEAAAGFAVPAPVCCSLREDLPAVSADAVERQQTSRRRRRSVLDLTVTATSGDGAMGPWMSASRVNHSTRRCGACDDGTADG